MAISWIELAAEDEAPLRVKVKSSEKELVVRVHTQVCARMEAAPETLEGAKLSLGMSTEGKRVLLRLRFLDAGGFVLPKAEREWHEIKVRQLATKTPIPSSDCEARLEADGLVVVLPETFEIKEPGRSKASAAVKKA